MYFCLACGNYSHLGAYRGEISSATLKVFCTSNILRCVTTLLGTLLTCGIRRSTGLLQRAHPLPNLLLRDTVHNSWPDHISEVGIGQFVEEAIVAINFFLPYLVH